MSCSCINSTTPTPPTPCNAGVECCLKVCNDVLSGSDSVGPCGTVGTYDLSELPHITTGCEGSVTYILESWDEDFFDTLTLSSAGVLTWTFKNASEIDITLFGEVKFRLQCVSHCDEDIVLNATGTIRIGVEDLCVTSNCDTDETCNPCDGDCDPTIPDVEIT